MNRPLTMTAEREADIRDPSWPLPSLYVSDLLKELDATRAALDASEEHFRAIIDHLQSWQDRAGHFHDLTNPEAQVQPILDKLDASEQRFKARIEELEAQVAHVPFVNHVNGSPVYQLLQKRLDASEQTIRELRAVADKLAGALSNCITGRLGGQPGYVNTLALSQGEAALAQYAEMKSDKLASSVVDRDVESPFSGGHQ